MQLRYDEDLVESAVFLCANHGGASLPALQVGRFHREREKLYSILDPEQRNAAFFKLHLEWFREWGLERTLLEVLDEFPMLKSALNVLAFRKARGKNDEGAELYVNSSSGKNAVIALTTERFGDPPALLRLLRHELMHVHDMLDPAFGYSPGLHLPGQNMAQQRLTRERYRLLWKITVDGRLANSGRAPLATREHHHELFARAYSFWPVEKREDVFETLWRNPAPRHGDLLAMASDPRDLSSVHEPLPGASCPLCGFSTFRWADASRLDAHLRELITAEFPTWEPSQGLCQRCLQVFNHLGSSQLAHTPQPTCS